MLPATESSTDIQHTLGLVLKEISEIVASLDDTKTVLDALVRLVARTMSVDRCSLMLIDPATQELRIRAARHIEPEIVRRYRAKPGDGIAGWVVLHGKPLLIKDLDAQKRFKGRGASDYANKSLLSMPLIHRDDVVGVLNVNNKLDGKPFSEADELLLSAVANFVVAVLERAKLKEVVVEKERIDADIALARETQEAFFPRPLPDDGRIQFATYSRCASNMAGDFYDIIPITEDRTCLVMGDVCGKGIASALYMAHVLGCFRAAVHSERSAGELLTQVNRLVSSESSALAFVTACVAVFDADRNTMSFCNAGHLHPYILHEQDRSLSAIKGGRSFPLGVESDGDYESIDVGLDSGDNLVLYTDGITEAENPRGEFFGRARLEQTLVNHRGSAQELVQNILSAVRHFAGSKPQTDDQTLVVARRT